MTQYVKITFNTEKLLIELLDTPLVKKWLTIFNRYKDLNIPSVAEPVNMFSYGEAGKIYDSRRDDTIEQQRNAVIQINQSIDNVNQLIVGKQYPYRAYEGMSWMQTNRIHRCFTTASFSASCWHHGLTEEQLLECKTLSSIEVRQYVRKHAPQDYTVLDMAAFDREIHIINANVHIYEDRRHSLAAQQVLNDMGSDALINSRFNIKWDKDFTFTEDKVCLRDEFCNDNFLGTITYQELLDSFPENHSEYDVVVHKSIGGKDYETCYTQYDDASEADIRNIEHINGCMTLHFGNADSSFTDSSFSKWAKGYGLADVQVLSPPLGKIVENTITDYNSLTKIKPIVELI